MKTKISKAEFDALGADEQKKYAVSTDNEDEYVLQAAPPADPPKPSEELTPAQKRAIAAQLKEEKEAAVKEARANWELERKTEEDKKKGEFQKLYEELEPKYASLEQEVNALRAIVDAEIEQKASALPEELQPLYEMVGENRDSRLKWLQKASSLQPAKLGEAPPRPPKPGTKEAEAELREIEQS